ncbi:hypothetical protein ACVULE_004713, partial [Escherichia coli]
TKCAHCNLREETFNQPVIALMNLIFWGGNTTIVRQTIDLPVVQAYSSYVVANSATGFDSLNVHADNRRYPHIAVFLCP